MFSLKDFILDTLEGMLGNYPVFQVREYALNWYAKGELNLDDLAYLDTLINPPIVEEEIVEELTEDMLIE